MNYDYTFFEKHAAKKITFKGARVHSGLADPLCDFFGSEEEMYKYYDVIFKPAGLKEYLTEPSIVRSNGAYYKGGQSIAPLEASLKAKLPDDFVQFYERFGQAVIITRTMPILLYPLQQMIDDFEDDPDIDIEEGRFFRFAGYQDPLYLGLRRHEETDEWQVVICTYGLLYSEMIGPQGRGNVVAPSFYAWLKHLVETNGYPDEIYPRDPDAPYLNIMDEE